MCFDITRADQCAEIERNFKRFFYGKMNELSKKTIFIRPFGIVTGAISALSNIIRRIGLIVENALKAIVNIFGCLFVEECKLQTGLFQICNASIHLICLPFTLFRIPFPLICNTVGIAIFPENFTKFCREHYDLTSEEIEDICKKEQYYPDDAIHPGEQRVVEQNGQMLSEKREKLEYCTSLAHWIIC